ncbi:MAG: hypothetical protein GXN93_04785 [Candidatus Diapherotrites archaeon]|nr:hypothetical protein [Candidatus Diapherotrites archaeon]
MSRPATTKVAPSVEHLTIMLSWRFPQWRNFVRDVLYDVISEGRAYARTYHERAGDYGVSARTLQRWFKRLVDIGILEKRREGKVGEGGSWYYTISSTLAATVRTLCEVVK